MLIPFFWQSKIDWWESKLLRALQITFWPIFSLFFNHQLRIVRLCIHDPVNSFNYFLSHIVEWDRFFGDMFWGTTLFVQKILLNIPGKGFRCRNKPRLLPFVIAYTTGQLIFQATMYLTKGCKLTRTNFYLSFKWFSE